MLAAYRELQEIHREVAARAELPVAQLTALMANINRDTNKSQPFSTEQFCFYREERRDDDALSPEVAAVALALRHENRCPPLVIAAWPKVLEASKGTTRMPEVRALVSDDEAIWVLAPRWEAGNVRGGLVAVKGRHAGPVVLRELDRPLIRHRLKLPERQGFGWLEADLLLVAAS